MHATLLRIGLVILIGLMCATPVAGQFHEPDPEARQAFIELIEAYRERPGLTVNTHVGIELREGDIKGRSSGVEATFVLGRNRTGVVKMRDFTVYLGEGRIHAIHDDNEEAYFSASDEGSPYYSLMTAFMDMPFPHLAIAFGEDDIDDLCMQFHPRAAWCRPTAVRTERRGERSEAAAEDDRPEVQLITMTSDFEEIEIVVEPDTKLMQSVTVRIFDGHFVEPGTEMILRHRFSYEEHDEPPVEQLAFEPGDRQRVDSLMALVPRREVAAPAPNRRGVAGGGMIGQPAPPFDLGRLDGGRITLEDLKGRVVVLDFWATWCRPCLEALPKLHEIAAWTREQQMSVTVLTVNTWEIPGAGENDPGQRREQALAFWERHGFTLPVLMDHDDTVAAQYGVQGIPTTIIIRPDGVIHMQHIGVPEDDQLKQDIIDAFGDTEL